MAACAYGFIGRMKACASWRASFKQKFGSPRVSDSGFQVPGSVRRFGFPICAKGFGFASWGSGLGSGVRVWVLGSRRASFRWKIGAYLPSPRSASLPRVPGFGFRLPGFGLQAGLSVRFWALRLL